MIKTRIASTAAAFTFGLAALGGTVGIAANADADTGSSPGNPAMSETIVTSGVGVHAGDVQGSDVGSGNRFEPARHEPFPTKPHSPHDGQGKKAEDEPQAHPTVIWPAPEIWPGSDVAAAG
jgi:hypothetical protein